jgi:hypothetical protein
MRAKRAAGPSPRPKGLRMTSVPAARSTAAPRARSAMPSVWSRSTFTSTTTSRTPGRELSADRGSPHPNPRTTVG